MWFVSCTLLSALLGWPADVSAGTPSFSAETPPSSSAAPDEPRYLLIHLDGVSADLFAEEMEAGHLENLRAFFSDHGIIRHGVTFFPPFTSNVVLRLRLGLGMEEGEVLDWGPFDSDEEVQRGRVGVFMEYAASVPRRTRSNFIHAFPVLDHLAGLSLWNVPEKLDAYGVVEFYWFGTDTAGHVWGEDAIRENLRRFDRYFRGLARNLDDDVHVVIYADHGMIFGEVEAYDAEVQAFLDGRIRNYAYPNIHLSAGEDPEEVARELVSETWQDFAFFQMEPGWVAGFDAGGRRLHIRREGGGGEALRSADGSQPTVSYRFEGPGPDPLRYEELGYRGEPLTPDEWLELTHDQTYPYAPIRILELFSNPRAGDVVTVLNDQPKAGPWVYAGNHHGLSRSDMAVPVLVRGSELEHLYERSHVRLENLLARTSLQPFAPRTPSRERHEAVAWALEGGSGLRLGGELIVSPRYRTRLGLRAEAPPHGGGTERELWGSWDVVSGFLSRFWVGAGVQRGPEVDGTRFLVRVDHEMRVRRVGAVIRLSTARSARLDLFFRMHDQADLQLRNLEGLGVRVRF